VRRAADRVLHLLVIALGCAVAIGAAAVLSASARAQDLKDQQAMSIYMLAYGQYGGARGGIPMPAAAPVVHKVSQVRLQQLAGCARCPIRGYHEAGHVYIDEALDFSNAFDASILLHEFVHYLQYIDRGPKEDCAEWLRREHEAYLIQANVLAKVGEDPETILESGKQLARRVNCAAFQ